MQEIRVAGIREEDIPVVAGMEREIFADFWTERGLRETLAQKNTILAGAWKNGRMVGYVIMYYVLDEGEIARIAVDREYRRQGVAARLISELQDRCREAGIARILLDVRVGNEPAIAFYRRMGFKKDGIRRGYYVKPEEDALLMSLEFGDGSSLSE